MIDVLILATLSYYQCRNRTCALFCTEKMSCAVLLPVLIAKRKLLFIMYLTGEDNFCEILNSRRYNFALIWLQACQGMIINDLY